MFQIRVAALCTAPQSCLQSNQRVFQHMACVCVLIHDIYVCVRIYNIFERFIRVFHPLQQCLKVCLNT